MKKTIAIIIAAYIIASVLFSAAFAISDNREDMLQYRCGLLCVEITEDDLVVYSPFNNFEDVFLMVIDFEDGSIYSDGLYGFLNII